jgi:hypothetical protein
MLSLESIERRLENPKAYYIFYGSSKAAVGSQWKECMDSSEVIRIGNDIQQRPLPFTLCRNNYKAWLKVTHGGEALWTRQYGEGLHHWMKLLLDQEFVVWRRGQEGCSVIPQKQTYKKQ